MDKKRNKATGYQQRINEYRRKMEEIDFMSEHIVEFPGIFDVGSEKCRLFLIKSFTTLNPHFHYLSLLSNDVIDQELQKAACILQLYPFDHNQKGKEIFHSLNELEIHNFWLRFFELCKLHCAANGSSVLNKGKNNCSFHSFFSYMYTASRYFNYDMSITNPKKLRETDVNQEISSWETISVENDIHYNKENCVPIVHSKQHQNEFDCDQFMCDVNKLKKEISHQQVVLQEPVYYHKEFFVSFNHAVKEIMQLKNNLDLISSVNLEHFSHSNQSFFSNVNSLSNNNQIKRCNNIIKSIESRKR